MKFLTTILGIYIMGLSFVPCVDGELPHDYAEKPTVERVVHQNNHSHDSQSCAPFCLCQCCQIQLALFNFSILQPVQAESSLETPIYRLFIHDYFPALYFQPPQV